MDGWKQNEPLAPYTTFGIGGPARYFVAVGTVDELRARLHEADAHSCSVRILGGGSNILVSDTGTDDAVIKMEINGIETERDGEHVRLRIGAGESFDNLVAYTVTHGYWGLENLSHIPGTVGATVVQNVGAYGVEIGELIESVEVFDPEIDTVRALSRDACAFSYRDSVFKHEAGKQYVVTHITLTLSAVASLKLSYKDLERRFGNTIPTQAEIRDAIIEIRSKKFPDWRVTGTAGSFFKNPIIATSLYQRIQARYPDIPGFSVDGERIKIPLGWILDKALGLRGVREGNVGTYEGQALVIVNYGNATAAEIEAFASHVRADVSEHIGINIEWEVTKW